MATRRQRESECSASSSFSLAEIDDNDMAINTPKPVRSAELELELEMDCRPPRKSSLYLGRLSQDSGSNSLSTYLHTLLTTAPFEEGDLEFLESIILAYRERNMASNNKLVRSIFFACRSPQLVNHLMIFTPLLTRFTTQTAQDEPRSGEQFVMGQRNIFACLERLQEWGSFAEDPSFPAKLCFVLIQQGAIEVPTTLKWLSSSKGYHPQGTSEVSFHALQSNLHGFQKWLSLEATEDETEDVVQSLQTQLCDVL
eukprot:m.191341 g.191341  ORF g.191341 m.191341 type:complete len:255 (+) comp14838_c0_seq2:454-1218(+)